MKFQIWKSKGNWYWHLKARNGRVVAQGEGYWRKRSAERAIAAIKLNAYDAPVVHKGKS